MLKTLVILFKTPDEICLLSFIIMNSSFVMFTRNVIIWVLDITFNSEE